MSLINTYSMYVNPFSYKSHQLVKMLDGAYYIELLGFAL